MTATPNPVRTSIRTAVLGLKALRAVYRRELLGYFQTPTAYVFLAIFLFASGAFGFHIGRFFDQGAADLSPFFAFHPWLLLIFMPAVSMRLWSEEIRGGSFELLLTLPVPIWSAVTGKFLAAWTVAAAALALTTPLWLTVAILGQPDHAAILTAYLGSLLMAGGYLAIGGAASALTGNQVIAFILGVFAAFLLTAGGMPIVVETVSGFANAAAVEAIAGLSPLERYESIRRGVVELRDLVYFASLITAWLAATAMLVYRRRGG
jgi:ABC-2 type transport system permease protein